MFKAAFLALAVAIAFPVQDAYAQGRLAGDLKQSNGAPIAGAQVACVNKATMVVAATVVTNGSGQWITPVLPAGTYVCTASAVGFKQNKYPDFVVPNTAPPHEQTIAGGTLTLEEDLGRRVPAGTLYLEP